VKLRLAADEGRGAKSEERVADLMDAVTMQRSLRHLRPNAEPRTLGPEAALVAGGGLL